MERERTEGCVYVCVWVYVCGWVGGVCWGVTTVEKVLPLSTPQKSNKSNAVLVCCFVATFPPVSARVPSQFGVQPLPGSRAY